MEYKDETLKKLFEYIEAKLEPGYDVCDFKLVQAPRPLTPNMPREMVEVELQNQNGVTKTRAYNVRKILREMRKY